MIERGVVKDLHDQLLTGVVEKQEQAASAIRDLCAEREEYREVFASTVPHLAGLIDTTAGDLPTYISYLIDATYYCE
jgi:hypothetical protein